MSRKSARRRPKQMKRFAGAGAGAEREKEEDSSKYNIPVLDRLESSPTPTPTPSPEYTYDGNKEKALNLANQLISSYLERINSALGLDPTQSVEQNVDFMKEVAQGTADALQTEEGKRLQQEVAEQAIHIVTTIIKPVAEQVLDEVNDLVEKETTNGLQMINKAALVVPVAGQVIAAIEEAGHVALAVETLAEKVTKLTNISVDFADRLHPELDKIKEMVNQTRKGMNSVVGKSIDHVSQSWKEDDNTGAGAEAGAGGGIHELTRVRHQASLIGGRVNDSRALFLSPSRRRMFTLKRKNTDPTHLYLAYK